MFISHDMRHNGFDIIFPRFPSKIFLSAQRDDPLIQEAKLNITRYDWQQWR